MSVFLIGSVVANFSIGMTMAILPSFADSLGGVKSYGFFLAAISAGSLIGALFSSWVGNVTLAAHLLLALRLVLSLVSLYGCTVSMAIYSLIRPILDSNWCNQHIICDN